MEFSQLDIIEPDLVEGVLHGILNIIERDENETMNTGQ